MQALQWRETADPAGGSKQAAFENSGLPRKVLLFGEHSTDHLNRSYSCRIKSDQHRMDLAMGGGTCLACCFPQGKGGGAGQIWKLHHCDLDSHHVLSVRDKLHNAMKFEVRIQAKQTARRRRFDAVPKWLETAIHHVSENVSYLIFYNSKKLEPAMIFCSRLCSQRLYF